MGLSSSTDWYTEEGVPVVDGRDKELVQRKGRIQDLEQDRLDLLTHSPGIHALRLGSRSMRAQRTLSRSRTGVQQHRAHTLRS